jgi:(2S)-methylsuccinyl-CoA dehydrogenase
LRSTLRDFADRRIRPIAQSIHRDDLDVPDDLISGVAQLGLFGLSIPERYGGSMGARPDNVSMLIGTEELSAASLAAGGSLMTRPEILVRALLSGANEFQKMRWLPLIADGSALVAVAVTEPNAGSDVANLQCRAVKNEDGSWVLSGTKLWCTFAGRAHLLMLLCRTGPDDSGRRGLSLLVAEKPSFTGRAFEVVQPQGDAWSAAQSQPWDTEVCTRSKSSLIDTSCLQKRSLAGRVAASICRWRVFRQVGCKQLAALWV